jgi:D-proline reductase (dithiol) PrdB
VSTGTPSRRIPRAPAAAPLVRADASWLASFRAAHAAWWEEAGPALERHEYAAAFKTYPWPVFATGPWAPLTSPLAGRTVAVITTAGLYRPGHDLPFDEKAPDGDATFRALPGDVPIQGLGIAHPHYPHEPARADMNAIFPLDRLAELARDGVIGGVATTHYSLMGFCTRAADLAEQTAPAIAAGLAAEGVGAVLIVPV